MHKTLLLILAIIVNTILSSAGARAADTSLDGAKKEAAVVVYTGSSAGDAAKLIAAFESKYPFVKVNLFRGNNERVLNRILTEGRTGSFFFDVATIDGLNAWVLKEHDYLQPHKSRETQAFPLEFQDPTGMLPCCMTVVANMIAYNTRQVAKQDAPKTYQDLLDPKWKGSLGMDPDEADAALRKTSNRHSSSRCASECGNGWRRRRSPRPKPSCASTTGARRPLI